LLFRAALVRAAAFTHNEKNLRELVAKIIRLSSSLIQSDAGLRTLKKVQIANWKTVAAADDNDDDDDYGVCLPLMK